jgi:hypothetical protein
MTVSTAGMRALAGSYSANSPVTGILISALADDLDRGGPMHDLVSGHPEAGSPFFLVRLLAGVRWLMLTGRAVEMVAFLKAAESRAPQADDAERLWALASQAVRAHPREIAEALDRPVQQHMPGRAAALLGGLSMIGAPEVRLLELGACAGLNLLVDKYLWFGADWQWGDPDSPVRLAVKGRPPREFTIVERAGCDLAPLDPSDEDDVNIIRSFVPPDATTDLLALDDALAVAARSDVRVQRADAVEWLSAKLAAPHSRSVHTVVWHSMFWGYLSADAQERVEQALSAASARGPVARIAFEPRAWHESPRLQVTVY